VWPWSRAQVSSVWGDVGLVLGPALTPSPPPPCMRVPPHVCTRACASVSNDYATEVALVADSPELAGSFVLPDGSFFAVGAPRVKVPELLFDPSLGPRAFWTACGVKASPMSLQVLLRGVCENVCVRVCACVCVCVCVCVCCVSVRVLWCRPARFVSIACPARLLLGRSVVRSCVRSSPWAVDALLGVYV
jgi:hypothetical protein